MAAFDNISALVQVVALHQTSTEPLPEPMMTKLHSAIASLSLSELILELTCGISLIIHSQGLQVWLLNYVV